MTLNRRDFISQSSLLISLPVVGFASHTNASNLLDTKLKSGDIILFQGDSITDARREKDQQLPNNIDSMGKGYAFLVASYLLSQHVEKALTIYNRGISGDKVYQLQERWQKDVIDLRPNWVSILIGVNDYWHKRKHGYKGTVALYKNDLRALIQNTLDELPGVQIVLCEPFILPNTSAVDASWLKPFKAYQKVVFELAQEFNTLWVPFQSVFNEAIKQADATYWTPDGVHPSMAGSQLMANAWLEVVNNSWDIN
jgi:lysophospholipase L1-like esterase|tara:strand:- start:881 stop:1642 length:762 start_codon:yes stop_codon:yes gene_type:complete